MSLVGELHQQHKERRARIESRAVKDAPIDLSRASRERKAARETKVAWDKVQAALTDVARVSRDVRRMRIAIEEITAQFPVKTAPSGVTLARIVSTVSEFYGVSIKDIKSTSRTGDLIRPRHVISYLGKKLTTHSMPSIGRFLGGRDHTTILHGIRRIEDRLPEDDQLAEDISKLLANLKPAEKNHVE